jgi:hypothetical protein
MASASNCSSRAYRRPVRFSTRLLFAAPEVAYNICAVCTMLLVCWKTILCTFFDFAKAFDCVDHVVLVQKLSKLKLPEYIYFLTHGLSFYFLEEVTQLDALALNLVLYL